MDHLSLSDSSSFYVSRFDGSVPSGVEGLGLYSQDTRHISRLELLVWGQPPTLLASADTAAYEASILLSNPRHSSEGMGDIPADSISITRRLAVEGAVFERIDIRSYHHFPVALDLMLAAESDFADIFEVRGLGRGARGSFSAHHRPGDLTLEYNGTAGFRRATSIRYDVPEGVCVDAGVLPCLDSARGYIRWGMQLEAGGTLSLTLTYRPQGGQAASSRAHDLSSALGAARRTYHDWYATGTRVRTGSEAFNALLSRSATDLRALTAEYPTGPLPVAGIPWYAVPFGRDSILTSLEALLFRPDLAVGTLRFLAAHQGTRDDPYRDEEPGKILHELRFGELAQTRAVPHTPYFGTADATPLFVMLFAETVRWTGDEGLYAELLPAAKRAVEWIDRYGDVDGDGYVEYATRSPKGIRNQGWKDSDDSLLYEDGSLVDPPAALVEVQAYVYAAKVLLADLLDVRGESEYAAKLHGEAAMLRARFNRDYWLADEGYYAQALDHRKRQVRAVTSNPGHALMCGILPPERARLVADRLLQPDMSSGWGIRTRSSRDPSYNPMSYHNGSVWPHDSALIAYGMYRYGLHEAGEAVAGQLMEASEHFRLRRLPELMCGFSASEAPARAPVPYDVSCSPQAWASGLPFLLLRGMLGLQPDARSRRLDVDPHVPGWLGRVSLEGLQLGSAAVSLDVVDSRVEGSSTGGWSVGSRNSREGDGLQW